MIRWFADLPIERKLRVVILVPAIAVFAVAMVVHVAMNLLHLRDDLQWSAARVARVTGASTIEALRLGDDKAALKAVSALREEWLVSDAEILAANGRKLATYRRGHSERSWSRRPRKTPWPFRVRCRPWIRSIRSCTCGARNSTSLRPSCATAMSWGTCDILVPLEVVYPDWPRLPPDHAGGDRGRRADRRTGSPRVCSSKSRDPSSIWRRPCSGCPSEEDYSLRVERNSAR